MSRSQPTDPPARRSRPAAPSAATAVREVIMGALFPAVLVFLVLLAVGLILRGRLPADDALTEALTSEPTPVLDTVAQAFAQAWWTETGTAPLLAIGCAVVILVLTRRWWWALVPVLATLLASGVAVLTGTIVTRPAAEAATVDAVATIDAVASVASTASTASVAATGFPSGPTRAAFALCLSVALVVARTRPAWVRRMVGALAVVLAAVVGLGRLTQGVDRMSDVVVGALLGIWAAYAAARCISEPDDPGWSGHDTADG